ncbi:MAG TPA: hypothetical protein H9880_06670 [Candidatus Anaerobutyricum avicola]|nr:hypothetical protein [Candidatus Anaerobutyricum avicola]
MECKELYNIPIFKKNMSTFKETSYDKDGEEPGYMTDSQIQVINFDKVKDGYIKNLALSNTPCSNDALYFGKDNKIFFVEFKNGVLDERPRRNFNICKKIYDSLLIFNDIVNKNISFCRENLYFILVYNENKNKREACKTEQEESSKAIISKKIHKKAKKKFIRFGLDRFEKLYFKEVFTYTESEFEDAFLSQISD